MYWEARGEGRVGMAAVGAVVMNRVASSDFPDDACSVVYQGGETPPCQFSWWCDGKSDRPQDGRLWALALDTAADVLDGSIGDPTNGALYFHSTAIKRPWRKTQTARIGRHLFYR
jgi:N-acetylmuramoyl-L-alanine amidase